MRAPLSFLIAVCLATFAGAQTPAAGAPTAAAQKSVTPHSSTSPVLGATLSSRLASARAHHRAHQAAAKPTRAAGGVTPMCDAPKSKLEARCFAMRVNGVEGGKGVRAASATPHGLAPGDLVSAYNLPKDGGAGATIAIVDAYDNPNAASDLAVYREQFDLPPLKPGQFIKVNQRGLQGDYPQAHEGWAAEISLDLDMVSAIAPNANIILVEADSATMPDLGAGVNQAVALGASYVSNSYGTGYSTTPGSGEWPTDRQTAQQYYDHPGVAVVASSGDSSYGVSFPASSPHVTAVGGTSLVRDPDTARGWKESVWSSLGGGPGSGCSTTQLKPSFQKDTGCAHRTVADVSAVADPVTGVAVYDTYGSTYGTGWGQYGGTSASAPIIAATYALSGSMLDSTYPNSYPYAHTDNLNDVTSGSNGTCDPTYLCTAAPGYDGPTGLGTPNGTAAFSSGPAGTLSGTITEASTGKPVSGAKVNVTGASSMTTTTGPDGTYRMRLAAGSYDLDVSAFAYADKTTNDVTVSADTTTTADAKLTKVPLVTVSGTVADASGHGWSLYAGIVVDNGIPGGPIYSDPVTGKYSVRLPVNGRYTLHATSNYPGYQERDTSVTTKTTSVVHDIGLTASPVPSLGSTFGYTQKSEGDTETFDELTTPADWTVDTAAGDSWRFDDQNGPVGDVHGGFAYVPGLTIGTALDSSLISREFTVPASQTPFVSFETNYYLGLSSVDYSTDGGKTWTTEWSDDGIWFGHVTVAMPASGKEVSARVRFRRQISTPDAGPGGKWTIDNVRLGGAWVTPQPGGLVVGNITDGSTSKPVDGVPISLTDQPAQSVTSAPMAGIPGRADGFYWFFTPLTGQRTVTAAKYPYHSASRKVKLAANKVTAVDLTLHVGRLKTSGPVSATVPWRGSATRDLTLTNTGDAPLRVKLNESTSTTASGPAWTSTADLPAATDAMVAGDHDGTVYAGLGAGADDFAPVASFYAYDPATETWRQKADAPSGVVSASGGFIDGKFYASGGYWVAADFSSMGIETRTQVYDPATNTWSVAADNPDALASSGAAVLDGKLYTVGGMNLDDSFHSTASAYDPKTNKWSTIHSYPERINNASCGGMAGKLYCAGGFTNRDDGVAGSREVKDAFVYDPADDSWTQIADLPIDMAQAAYGVADGRLLISGGITRNGADVTDQGYAYDPAMNWWTPLPSGGEARNLAAGVVGTRGFHLIGGKNSENHPSATVSVLSGYDRAGPVDVPWLAESRTTLTIQPGRHTTVRVRLNARHAAPAQPGTVTATLGLGTDGFCDRDTVPVSMTVQTPAKGAVDRH
ncbi:carboxypeptidase regulatory-like domain-containing protein [Streptomyces sp. NPDC051664]|uniref:carboxypeptidase regulatory-like domain-containing protein n=1 Tax=Streptomyces sp. NPDC051664 TaxID=3365668 RepID=UPI0037A8D5AB